MLQDRIILLTGATGYVGGRLLKELEAAGHTVRCLVRQPALLAERIGSETQVVRGDLLDPATLPQAMKDVHTAYYLVHSMGESADFQETDRTAARNFLKACEDAGVRRIIYLGGLGDSSGRLSPHLRSRQEVGDILRSGSVEVIEFRASIIIGSGSLSFEMIRALVERLPVMLAPRWVGIPAQPIAITDVLRYLVCALGLPLEGNRVFEIGGADIVSYGDIMREYARQRKLRRIIITSPLLTPWLSSLWLALLTPLYASVGRRLIESIRNATVVRDDSAARTFGFQPVGIREAIASALRHEDQEYAETRWCDAVFERQLPHKWGGIRSGSRLIDSRRAYVAVPPSVAFDVISRIGGRVGWYYGDWLWQFRGLADLLAGGVGMRRGRRHERHLVVGDIVDCWRVEKIEPGRLLRFMGEMRIPGRHWLEFEVQPFEDGSVIRQRAIFDPVGLYGILYWYAAYLVHQPMFAGMINAIARRCEEEIP